MFISLHKFVSSEKLIYLAISLDIFLPDLCVFFKGNENENEWSVKFEKSFEVSTMTAKCTWNTQQFSLHFISFNPFPKKKLFLLHPFPLII